MILYAEVFAFAHCVIGKETVPKIDFGPFMRSVIVALIFFAIGRFIVVQTEGSGRWLIYAGLVIFYAAWWFFYRRGTRKK
jgi:hypothetical protein